MCACALEKLYANENLLSEISQDEKESKYFIGPYLHYLGFPRPHYISGTVHFKKGVVDEIPNLGGVLPGLTGNARYPQSPI